MSTDNNKNKKTNEERVEEMGETIGKGGEQASKAIEMRARAAHDAREAMREGAEQASKAIEMRARAAYDAREAMREGAEQAGAIRCARTIRKGMKEGNEAEKEKNQDDDAE